MKTKLSALSAVVLIISLTGQVQATGNPPNLANTAEDTESKWIYSTNGVHSGYGCDTSNNFCIAPRDKYDLPDPQFPQMWISDWTMFTVTNTAASDVNPPPYTNPPIVLEPDDYIVSYGTSFYDNTYQPENPEDDEDYGAMMEHYNDFCLPIFGKSLKQNTFTCAFVSLGKKAFFLDYDNKTPEGTPDCCMFSPSNHPPRPDFIKHLDVWPDASLRLNGSVQAYFWEQLWAIDANPRILFAYAFNREKSPQGLTPKSEWYQHPQSFFFSGVMNLGTEKEQNMIFPMISQNYSSFRIEKPHPDIWAEVAQWCPVETIKKCRLFPDQR